MKNARLLVFVLLCLSATAAWGQGEIYDKYAVRDSLSVAYVQGYRLDSVYRIDVILIRTKDSAAWDSLLVEFDVVPARPVGEMKKEGSWGVVDVLRDYQDPTQPMRQDTQQHCFLHVDYYERAICLFFTKDREEFLAVYKRIFKQGADRTNQLKKENNE